MNSFLEALKARCTVYELNGGRDWRLGRDEDIDGEAEGTDAEKAIRATSKRRTWFGWGEEERRAFETAVEAVTQGRQGASGCGVFLTVYLSCSPKSCLVRNDAPRRRTLVGQRVRP
jgi:hypothetical protein